MGKALVLVVLGLWIIMGIIGLALAGRSGDSWKSSMGSYRKTCAKDIAESAADVYINQVRANASLRGTFTVSVFGGQATVTITQPDVTKDSLVIVSSATYENVGDAVTAGCTRTGSITVNAPIMYSKGATGGTWIFNDSQIDGRNYSYSTGVLDPTYPSMRGFTKEDDGVPTTFNNGGVTGSGGGPLPRDTVSLGGSQLDFTSLPNQLYPMANLVLSTPQTLASATWGTHATPQITFITDTVVVNGPCSGEGILVIAGPLNCNNTFSWNGIVIFCTKDPSWAGATNASFAVLTSGATVYGAMIDVGDNISYTANTSSNTFRYSKTIIDYDCSALGVAGGGKYSVAYWRE